MCRSLNGLDDFAVSGAAAEVALQIMPNLRFRRMRVLLQKRGCRQNHARRAEPALNGVMTDEGLL